MKRGTTIATLGLAAFAVGFLIWRVSAPRGESNSFPQIAVEFLPVVVAAGLAYVLQTSSQRQALGLLGAMFFPGLGHWLLGYKRRGGFFALLLVPLYLAGMALSDFANVSPFDRHPIWGLAQAPAGLLTLIAWISTISVNITRDIPTYAIGCLYTGVAGLLNILVMCDIYDLAGSKQASAATAPPSEANAC